MNEAHFGDRLAGLVEEKGSAVCVGLDPRWSHLPESLRSDTNANDLTQVAQVVGQFCEIVIDAVADVAPVVKPQAAFFEQLGPAGMQALWRVIQYARRAGLLVLLDGKRGDIGSTAEGYASAYLGPKSPWQCDALTVNPYLGDDTLEPFVKAANAHESGIFVLVKTSNAGSSFLQDRIADGQPLYESVAAVVQAHAAASRGTSGYGNVGAVVGATYPEQLNQLRLQMSNAWLLIPGFGAQGAGPAEVIGGFDSSGRGALVNSSRGIIFAYENRKYQRRDWQDSVAEAAREMRDQLTSAVSAR